MAPLGDVSRLDAGKTSASVSETTDGRQTVLGHRVQQPAPQLTRCLGLTIQGGRQRASPIDADPPRAITQWLRDNYPTDTRATTTWMTVDSPNESASAVSHLLTEHQIPHAVSGQVATDRIAPWSRPRTALVCSPSLWKLCTERCMKHERSRRTPRDRWDPAASCCARGGS